MPILGRRQPKWAQGLKAGALATWLGLVCFLAFFHGLFTLAPLDKTEALQIGIAETMDRLHEWVVPQWNGHLYSDKPPLPYWLAGLVWTRFGMVPEMARVPAALAATAGVAVLTFLTDRSLRRRLPPQWSRTRAVLAGSLLALSPGWIAFGHAAVHDIYLALAVMLALAGYALRFGLVQDRCQPLQGALWIGLCCGAGLLAKGLLGIVLPLLIIAVDASLNTASRRELLRPASLAMFSIGLFAVVSPWSAALIHGRHWAYLEGFLGFSHLQRATQAVDGHAQPLFFYLPVLMGLVWPWWPMLVPAIQQLWASRRRLRLGAPGAERLQQLAAVWLVVGLALFTAIPTKLPGYILPVLPAAVLLIATTPRQPVWTLRLVSLQLALASMALLLIVVGSHGNWLSAYGQQLQATPGSSWLSAAASMALLAALYGGCTAGMRRRMSPLLISMLLLVSCLPVLAVPYRQLEQEPLLQLAREAHQLHGDADVLFVLGKPRYSVVAEAQLPTIFGSPLKAASPRPDSSLRNWRLHHNDPEALVLGRCSSIHEIGQQPSVEVKLLDHRQDTCLARLQRSAPQP